MERREWVQALGTRFLLIQRDRAWTWAMDVGGSLREAEASFGSAEAALIAAGTTVFYLWVAEELSAVSLAAEPMRFVPPARPATDPSGPPPHGSGGG